MDPFHFVVCSLQIAEALTVITSSTISWRCLLSLTDDLMHFARHRLDELWPNTIERRKISESHRENVTMYQQTDWPWPHSFVPSAFEPYRFGLWMYTCICMPFSLNCNFCHENCMQTRALNSILNRICKISFIALYLFVLFQLLCFIIHTLQFARHTQVMVFIQLSSTDSDSKCMRLLQSILSLATT